MKINKIIFCMSIVLLISLVSAQDICETCIEEDPAMCPPECFGGFEDGDLPPPEGYICGDDSCDINEDCETCPEDCGECEEEITIPEECTESWACSAWSDCKDDYNNRTCTDSNNCGTSENKPNEILECEDAEGTVNISEEDTGKNVSDNVLEDSEQKQKGFWIYLILVIFVILIMIIVGYFLFKKLKKQSY